MFNLLRFNQLMVGFFVYNKVNVIVRDIVRILFWSGQVKKNGQVNLRVK